jgi:hypothetical protein
MYEASVCQASAAVAACLFPLVSLTGVSHVLLEVSHVLLICNQVGSGRMEKNIRLPLGGEIDSRA